MVRGYTRARPLGCGAGASEVWAGLLEAAERADAGPRTVGAVRQVFDRSAYLGFDPGALGGVDRLGPPLVLLAGEGFGGPLATRVTTDGPGGFRPDGLVTGAPCRLRRRAGGGGRYALAVGDAFDLELSAADLATADADRCRCVGLTDLTPGSAGHRRARAALESLAEGGVEDGLGWFDDLVGLAAGEPYADDLGALVDGWVDVLGGDRPPADPPTAVLGRGPGATPTGDDIVSGVLLALDRTADGARHRRVRAAGEAVVSAASDRTTTVSTALLAQAARGRAADRIDAAIDAVLGAGDPPDGWESTVRSAADVGHTSGVDLLLGALLVPLAIGPAVAARHP